MDLEKLITNQLGTNNSDLVVKVLSYPARGYIIRLLGRDFHPKRVARIGIVQAGIIFGTWIVGGLMVGGIVFLGYKIFIDD